MDPYQAFSVLMEVLSQGTVVAVLGGMLTLSLWVNLLQYRAKDALYDRLISAESKRADSAEKNTAALVTEITQVRLVMTELKELQRVEYYGALPPDDEVQALPPSADEDGSA